MADEVKVATATKTATEKKLSPKNKVSRGIDPSLITTWVPLDQKAEDRDVVIHAAAVRNVKPADMLQEMLHQVIKHHLTELKADADKYVPSSKASGSKVNLEEMSPEELDKYEKTQRKSAESAIERAQKAAEAAKALLAKARARQAEAQSNVAHAGTHK